MENTAKKQPQFRLNSDSIESYCRSCRARVKPLLATHYTFENVWKIQREGLAADLLRLLLNCLWALPYISVKKTAESVDKMGWSQLVHWTEHLPSGFKTSVQSHFERTIATELFQVDKGEAKMPIVKRELKKYALGRAVVANISTSLTTIVLGWLFFGKGNLSLFGLVNQLTEYFARDRASSNFVLGKSIGRSFYGIVKPEISAGDIVLSVVVFLAFLAVSAFATSILYVPLRKWLGLEEKKLLKMIDEIEDRLVIDSYKQ